MSVIIGRSAKKIFCSLMSLTTLFPASSRFQLTSCTLIFNGIEKVLPLARHSSTVISSARATRDKQFEQASYSAFPFLHEGQENVSSNREQPVFLQEEQRHL